MFSGINQSNMFKNVNFMNSYWKNTAAYGSHNSNSGTAGTENAATENTDSQQVSSREDFISILKDKGISEEAIAALPEKIWKRAEEKSEKNNNYNFGEDKQLQKLVDFLAKKSELMQSQQKSDQGSSDSADISQEALNAAATAGDSASEAEEADNSEESGVVTPETEDEEAAGAQNYGSIFDEFKDKLNQLLLNSLGLGDLSEAGASATMMSFSASFEISYSSMVAVAGENGMTMQSTSFNLKGSFEFMGIGSNLSGIGDSFDPFSFLSGNTDEVGKNDPMAKLKEYFSPEATADRILDFSLGFFGNSKQYKEDGNTEESRQNFADVIGAAIQKGFDQALGILGNLPSETQDEVDETHTRVFDGLDNFVKTGSKDGNEDEEVKEPAFDFAAYSSVFEMNYSSVTSYYTAEETGQALDDLYDRFFNQNHDIKNATYQLTPEQQEDANNASEAAPLDVTA